MSLEKLENNMAKLTVEVSAEQLDAAIKAAYNKNKGKFSIPGFRKGKVPQAMVEKMYGVEVFYDDALNQVIDETYPEAAKNCGEEIVSRPEIEIVSIEKGKGVVYTATVAIKPEVTLGEYKGLVVEKIVPEVTDEEVEAEILSDRKKQGRTAEVEDAIADGDTAVIDFKGYMDGVAFEGGEGADYELVIGSHSFIDTFEDQLIGKKAGDAVEVNVTFPEEYPAEDLAGKAAKFDVTVKAVKRTELPELNDEFASEVSDFETVDEYKADVKARLAAKKEKDAEDDYKDAVIEAAVANASMVIPEAMLDTQARGMVNDYAMNLQRQGLSLEQYMQFTGADLDKLVEQMKPEAERRIKISLVLEAIAKAENVEATEEAVDARIGKLAAQYGMDAAKVKELMGPNELDQMKDEAQIDMVIDMLVAEAKQA